MTPKRHLVVATCHDEATMQLLASMLQGDIRQKHGFARELELSIDPKPELLQILRRVPMDLRVQEGVGRSPTAATLGDWGQQIEGQRVSVSLNGRRIPYLADRPADTLLIEADVVVHGFFRKEHEDLAEKPTLSVRQVLQDRCNIPGDGGIMLLIVVDPEAEIDSDPAGGTASAPPRLAVVDLLNRIAMNSQGIDAVALAVTGLERSFAKIGKLHGETHPGQIARSDGYVRKLVAGLMEAHGHLFGMVQALTNTRTRSAIMPVSALGFIDHWEPNFDLLYRRPKLTPDGTIGESARELGQRNFFPGHGELLSWSPYLTVDPLVWLLANLRNPFAYRPQSFLVGRQRPDAVRPKNRAY